MHLFMVQTAGNPGLFFSPGLPSAWPGEPLVVWEL